MDLGLAGKSVVITGGSSGIGLGLAESMVTDGARVLICARRQNVLDDAARQIKQRTGKDIHTISVDVTDGAQLDRLREVALETFGGVDILINNAGTGIYKPFLEVTDQDLVEGMALNFFAQFRTAQRFVPIMQRQKSGSIVNVAGCSGLMTLDPPFLSTCTGPAKAAEIRFTKALAAEVGQWGIRVNCVAPNFVVTPERFERWQTTMNADRAATPEQLQQQWGARIALPGKRWSTIEEATNAIMFVASPAASYMTGSVTIVDGGYDRG